LQGAQATRSGSPLVVHLLFGLLDLVRDLVRALGSLLRLLDPVRAPSTIEERTNDVSLVRCNPKP
jgi:hypothetical protein